jgi:uncharacterized protein (TIGR03067 family)
MRTCLALALSVGLLCAARLRAEKPARNDALQKLQGSWSLVEVKGKQPAEFSGQARMIVKGNSYSVKVGDKTVEEGTIQVHDGKKPTPIDIRVTSGQNKGKTFYGIFEVAGDTARAAFGPAGVDRRPEGFSARGAGVMVRIYKREKK